MDWLNIFNYANIYTRFSFSWWSIYSASVTVFLKIWIACSQFPCSWSVTSSKLKKILTAKVTHLQDNERSFGRQVHVCNDVLHHHSNCQHSCIWEGKRQKLPFKIKCQFKFGERFNFFIYHSVTSSGNSIDHTSVPEAESLGSR